MKDLIALGDFLVSMIVYPIAVVFLGRVLMDLGLLAKASFLSFFMCVMLAGSIAWVYAALKVKWSNEETP